MFKVIPNVINRLDIERSRKLNAEDMKIALDELVRKSEKIENGKMLYKVIEHRHCRMRLDSFSGAPHFQIRHTLFSIIF